jgi:hypothetical protein
MIEWRRRGNGKLHATLSGIFVFGGKRNSCDKSNIFDLQTE